METAAEQGQDPISSTGERPVEPDNLTEQPLSSEDERIVSANPSPDAAVIGPSRDVRDQPVSLDAIGDLNAVSPHSAYASNEQPFFYGGYDNSTGNWDGYPHYLNADVSQVGSPVIYNDNPSLMFHSGYGFNPQMAYGQYSPVATPMPSIMVDGQLYSPQQMPFSPPYYPQPVPPSGVHITSAVPVSQTEMMVPESSSQEGVSDNMLYGPGSGYVVHFGSFGGGDLSGNSGCSPGFYNLQGEFGSGEPMPNRSNPLDADRSLSPLTSPAAYAQPFGILGSYELNVGQISQQQRPLHGPGLVSRSSSRHYPLGGSYHSSNFGTASISRSGANDRNRLTLDQSRRQERDRDSISISIESHDVSSDRNRGPRGKAKGKSTAEQSSSSGISKNSASTSGVHLDLYNRLDFVTDYESAKFFIIKSFSEDNVHRSIKYSIWASTPLGNRKLDAACHEAKEIGNCPVFLLFSVNASAQFCGLAEMVGPVDFEKNADYWQQDRWSGQFPVQWHIIKDVPNSRFRHILLENNDKKPVTHSRDTQEVKLEQGVEMLRIFKYHDACTSILDDFDFYDERERALQERKARQQASSKTDAPASLADDSINQISDSFAQGLQLEESNKEVPAAERGGGHQS